MTLLVLKRRSSWLMFARVLQITVNGEGMKRYLQDSSSGLLSYFDEATVRGASAAALDPTGDVLVLGGVRVWRVVVVQTPSCMCSPQNKNGDDCHMQTDQLSLVPFDSAEGTLIDVW